MVYIYTDGSAINNNNADKRQAGAAYVIRSKKITLQRGYYLQKNTNNYAELYAIKQALAEAMRHAEEFGEKTYNVITDSEYALKIVTKQNNARVNLELIEDIDTILGLYKKCGFTVKFAHVEAHTGAADVHSSINDICDKMAKKCAKDQMDIPLKVIGANKSSMIVEE